MGFSRPPMVPIHLLVKDTKNVYWIDFKTKQNKTIKTQAMAAFPHNFASVNGPQGQLYLVGGGDYQKDEETLY